jgi:hypothetical protein
VPGLPGDDRIECSASPIPRFERRHLHLDAAAARELGHPHVDPEHPAADRMVLRAEMPVPQPKSPPASRSSAILTVSRRMRTSTHSLPR